MLVATEKHHIVKGTENPWQPAAGIQSHRIKTPARRTSEIPQAVHTRAFNSSGFVRCTHLPIEITLMFPKSLLSVTWGRINTALQRAGLMKSGIYHDKVLG